MLDKRSKKINKKAVAFLAASITAAPLVLSTNADAAVVPNPSQDIMGLPGEFISISLKDVFGGASGNFAIVSPSGNSEVVQLELDQAGNMLRLYLNHPGMASFTVTLNGNAVHADFSVHVLGLGEDGRFDVGDLAQFMYDNPAINFTRSSISGMLAKVAPRQAEANHVPTAAHTFYTVNYTSGMQIDLTQLVHDADEDTLTFYVSPAMDNGVHASIAGNWLTLSGTASGKAAFSVSAVDKEGAYARLTLVTNSVPLVSVESVSKSVHKNTTPNAISLPDNFSDPDGDTLTYSVTTTSGGGLSAWVSGNQLMFSGSITSYASFTVTATDSGGATNSATYEFNLENRAPVAQSVTQSIYYDASMSNFSLTKSLADVFTDADGDTLGYSVTPAMAANGMTATISGTDLTVAASGVSGSAVFTVTASDSRGGTASVAYTVFPNHKPTARTEASAYFYYNPVTSVFQPVDLSEYFQDIDADTLTYTLASGSTYSGLTVSISGSTMFISGTINLQIPPSLIVTADDGKGGTFDLAFHAMANYEPVARENTRYLLFNKTPSETILTERDIGEDFSDQDDNALEYSIESVQGLPAGLVAEIVLIEGLDPYLRLTHDEYYTSPTGDIVATVVVKASDGKSEGRATYIFRSNTVPVAIAARSLEVSDDMNTFDSSMLFDDPFDTLTVAMSTINRGAFSSEQFWLTTTEPYLLQFNNSAPSLITGSVSVSATDSWGLTSSATTFELEKKFTPAYQPAEKEIAFGSTLTLKNISKRYGVTDGVYTFKVASSDPLRVYPLISQDGKDLILQSGANPGPATITVIGMETGTNRGFIDQFKINIDGGNETTTAGTTTVVVPNPFSDVGLETFHDAVTSSNGSYTVSVATPDGIINSGGTVTFNFSGGVATTTFTIKSKYADGSDATVYEIRYPLPSIQSS